MKPLCESSNDWRHLYSISSLLLIRKLVKLKSSLVRKLSKAWLKFIIVIVQSKSEIAQTMRIVQRAAKIIGELLD